MPEGGYFSIPCRMEGAEGSVGASLVDDDPTDSRASLLISSMIMRENPRGKTVTVRFGPIVDRWWTADPETGEEQLCEGSGLTEAIRDHEWVFEDVVLDYPDQTIRLEPNVEIPWLDDTTTLTRLKVSPLSTYVMVEGGSCGDYVSHMDTDPVSEDGETAAAGGLTITFGGSDGGWNDKKREMEEALTVELTFKDGTRLTPRNYVSVVYGHKEGAEGPETPWFSFGRMYDNAAWTRLSSCVADPAQVDHVTVCGVDIPVSAPVGDSPAAKRYTPVK